MKASRFWKAFLIAVPQGFIHNPLLIIFEDSTSRNRAFNNDNKKYNLA
jgi:hypothetical protein